MAIIILIMALVSPGPALQKRNTRTAQAASSSAGQNSGQQQGSITIITGQAGSVIFLNNVRNGVTSDTGELKLSRIKPGACLLRVRTVGYEDWNGRIIVRPQSGVPLEIKQVRTADQAVLHYQKGDASRDAGNHDEAIAEYKQALALNARLVDAAIGCARSMIAVQQLEEAEAMLHKALKSRAGVRLAEAETVFGNLRRFQGLLDESVAHYRKALVLARGVSPEAHIGLALALEEKGAADESIAHFRRGLAQDMDTEPILYYLLGKALEKNGRTKEAIEAYSGYLRLEPDGQYSSAVQSIIEQLKDR